MYISSSFWRMYCRSTSEKAGTFVVQRLYSLRYLGSGSNSALGMFSHSLAVILDDQERIQEQLSSQRAGQKLSTWVRLDRAKAQWVYISDLAGRTRQGLSRVDVRQG
jgi:hypothetical protein